MQAGQEGQQHAREEEGFGREVQFEGPDGGQVEEEGEERMQEEVVGFEGWPAFEDKRKVFEQDVDISVDEPLERE